MTIIKYMRHYSLLSLTSFFASIFALGVIALGAFTRLIDAGLGCPDWPGCYGHFVIPLSEKARQLAVTLYPDSHFVLYKAWAEMLHRYFVGGLSFFIIGISFLIFVKKEFRRRSNMILAVALLFLLTYQIVLGKWTVTLKLMPAVVTQHLLGGFLILSVLWLLYLTNRISDKKNREPSDPFVFSWAIIGVVVLLLQITLGAWTSTHYASLSCPDFPFCVNNFSQSKNPVVSLPFGINPADNISLATRQMIQMMHRLGALIVTLYILIFSAYAVVKLKKRPDLIQSIYLIVSLLLIQLCIGISNVVFKLPLITAISHNLMAALLLLSMLTFVVKLYESY